MSNDTNAEHLGGGAYVSVTPEGIVFTANHHLVELATDRVYLDKYAIKVLTRWLADLKDG